ncbi:DUF1993 domain-containing protein [Enhygromyxa salina]|uniref:DUF1993 domain-containing protein n=1 Tax=Enhygromyxa salina TaxID=215803 RepID=A0A2S9XXB7_9BACT|nr:DUF1993 domain-containing protein [Enhygromyxa salina]PRP97361.1 hypothetical protein ENSA7_67110 [Enhygromyxa salina]
MSLYQHSVVQMSSMLRNLDGCLDKAIAFAQAKEFSADDFVGFRLAPDMRPLSYQVQVACDIAKFAGARLAGVEAPSNPDTETTMAELKARIASTLEFLKSVEERAVDGGADREVRLSFLPGMGIKGADYLRQMAIPNFYFHVTTAYALLRSAGVGVGKRDYITELALYPVTD